MLRHVVLLRFAPETSDEALDEIISALRDLPGLIPEIRGYDVGRDLGLAEGNAGIGVCADFDDAEAYAVYRDHPAHRAVIEQLILPILDDRAAVQFQL